MVLNQFDYSRTLISGALLQENLAEEIKIEDNAIILTFEVTFDGLELAEFDESLRQIRADKIEFNTGEDFQRDVVLIIDENFVNEYFL